MFDEWASESLLSGKSINKARNVLNQIYKRAFYDEVIYQNPVSRIERYKQTQIEPKPFSINEIKAILNSLPEFHRHFYEVAFFTGLRVGELLGLRWEDVDLDNNAAHIRVNITAGKEKAPKTSGSIRKFELHARAANVILQHKNSLFTSEKRVFVDPKNGCDYRNGDGLRKYIWKPALEKAGVAYRYPYQCRHTYASMMLSEGKNPLWVA